MKLELQHLAPYLPYGLKVRWGHYRESEPTFELTLDVLKDELDNDRYSIAPILRPLSDLTKEIEHNGERFVPYVKFGFIGSGHDEWVNECAKSGLQHNHLKINCWNKLFEWHFDIFELIPAELAIDINSLKPEQP